MRQQNATTGRTRTSCSSARRNSTRWARSSQRSARPVAAGSSSSPARRASARPPSCGGSATSTSRPPACSGARATHCSRRGRSGRCSRWPRPWAASSRSSSRAVACSRIRSLPHRPRARRAQADVPRAGGSPLGRRGDARRAAAARPQDHDRPGPRDRDLPRRRARPHAPASDRARRARLAPIGGAPQARAALARCDRGARRSPRDRRRRAAPHDRWQPVLRDRGARRRRAADPAHRARRGAGARRAPQPATRAACSRSSRSRRAGSSRGCSRSWPKATSTASRSAWDPGC